MEKQTVEKKEKSISKLEGGSQLTHPPAATLLFVT